MAVVYLFLKLSMVTNSAIMFQAEQLYLFLTNKNLPTSGIVCCKFVTLIGAALIHCMYVQVVVETLIWACGPALAVGFCIVAW